MRFKRDDSTEENKQSWKKLDDFCADTEKPWWRIDTSDAQNLNWISHQNHLGSIEYWRPIQTSCLFLEIYQKNYDDRTSYLLKNFKDNTYVEYATLDEAKSAGKEIVQSTIKINQ